MKFPEAEEIGLLNVEVAVPVTANLFIQASPETVMLVVEALPNVVRPAEALSVPVKVRFPKVVSPETARVPPIVALPVKPVFPETERVLKVPPDFTVREPLITASLANVKYVAERRSKPD